MQNALPRGFGTSLRVFAMPSELLSALFKRRSDVESAGQSWESKPSASSADASHLAELSFDGPSVQD